MPALVYPGVAYCASCGRTMQQSYVQPDRRKGVYMTCVHKYEHWNPDEPGHECRYYGKRVLIKPVLIRA